MDCIGRVGVRLLAMADQGLGCAIGICNSLEQYVDDEWYFGQISVAVAVSVLLDHPLRLNSKAGVDVWLLQQRTYL